MDIASQAIEQDELLGVEALEDIIDVENEMGFGEGEDWSDDDNDGGYSKLGATRKCALNKAGASRLRTSPVALRQHRLRKPLTARPGVKYGISSSTEFDERPKRQTSVAAPRRAVSSSFDSIERLGTTDAQSAESRDDTSGSLRSPRDNNLDIKSPSPKGQDLMQADVHSKHNGTGREAPVCNSKAIEFEGKKDIKKPDEKTASSNRVRFSLDFDAAGEVMGFANKKGDGPREKEKAAKTKEWRYVRATPSDSSGFGTPKAPTTRLVRVSSTQRRKESVVTEPLKDSIMGFDLERSIEARNDKKVLRVAQERLEMFEEAMLKQQEIVANLKLCLIQEGVKGHGKLRQLMDALDKNIRKSMIAKSRQIPQSYELQNRAEQINRLKAQCNLLETDRERLKKRLRRVLENAGEEKEKESVEVPSTEQENPLEHKVRDLERSLEEWETKFKKVESDFAMERAILEENLSECKLDWRNKQQKWATKLKEREAELSSLKASQEKLVDSLVLCRQGMHQLTSGVTAYVGGFTAQVVLKEHEEETPRGRPEEKNALNLAQSIQGDMESLKRLLEESSSALQQEPQLQEDTLRQESTILENKVSQTMSFMNELKKEIRAKEDQIKQENEKYLQMVAEKVKLVETLEGQLANKEQDMEGFMQELKDEISLLNKELEHERSERSRLSDMQGNMKYKLMKGLRRKEQKLEQEMEGLKETVNEMSAALAQKDERITLLEDEVKAKTGMQKKEQKLEEEMEGLIETVNKMLAALAQKDERIAALQDEVKGKIDQLLREKEKWSMAIKEVKHKAAKTILRFMHGKENGLSEHLRERRRHKLEESSRADILVSKTDEDSEEGLISNIGHPSRHNMDTENLVDWGSSFGLHSDKLKRDDGGLSAWKEDYDPREIHPKGLKSSKRSRAMEKREALKLLERRKDIGDNLYISETYTWE